MKSSNIFLFHVEKSNKVEVVHVTESLFKNSQKNEFKNEDKKKILAKPLNHSLFFLDDYNGEDLYQLADPEEPPSKQEDPPKKGVLGTGPIIGIVVSCVAAVAIVILLVYFLVI